VSRRNRTRYPGVFYREARRIGGKGAERVYYIVFKKDSKVLEEKVGRQFAEDMTPARAARIRADRIEGKRPSKKETRERQKALKEAWTIDGLWNYYKSQRKLKGLAQDESRYQNYIQPLLGAKEPHQIAPLDVDRLRLGLLKEKSPQTAKLTLALLQRIVLFGAKRRLCSPLSFAFEMPKVNNLKTEDLTREQLSNLLEAIDRDEDIQAANFIRMALYTGMRRGELFKLRWNDVDFERGFIHIRDPKGGPDEKIPLNDLARQVLENHPRTDSPYVFPGRKGGQRIEIRRPVNRIKNKAGLPKEFRPLHGLRHAYASMLASSGQVDMYTLQKLLTHKSPVMTQRYAHLRDDALRKASEVAGNIIEEALEGRRRAVPNK
jgi:integrase